MRGLLFILFCFVWLPLVVVDEYKFQQRTTLGFSVDRFAQNMLQTDTWFRPFRVDLLRVVSAAEGNVRDTVAKVTGTVSLLRQESVQVLEKTKVSGVSDAMLDMRIAQTYTPTDESGSRHRLHEYFGKFDWQPVRVPAILPDRQGSKAPSIVSIWLAQLSHFSYDHAKLKSKNPVWQSVGATWRSERGVCRDSATLLTDWLEHHGHDTRIAVGKAYLPTATSKDAVGHAWTVVRVEGVDYILESTSQTRESRQRVPPRAIVMTNYFPWYQANRTGEWRHPDVDPLSWELPKTQLHDYRAGWKRVN